MNRHILNGPIARLFLAPAIDTGGLNVPVIPAAGTGPTVTDVVLENSPAVEQSTPVKELEKSKGGIKGPEAFGDESPADSQERMGLAKDRVRGPDGRFLPKDQKSGQEAPQKPATPAEPQKGPPKATPVAQKPAQAKPAPAQPPVAPVKTTDAAPVAKIKVGDKEFTQEELTKQFDDAQKELADLRAKAAQPAQPVTPKEPAKPEPTPEEQAAADKERESNFIKTASQRYLMSEQDFDAMLASPNGRERLASMLAQAEMGGRQYAAAKSKEILDYFDSKMAELTPLLENHSRVSQLMEETALLNAHPEIKDHPKGAETLRKQLSDMRDGYELVQNKVQDGTASKMEHGWMLQYEGMSKEERHAAAANNASAELAKIPVEPVTPKVTAPPRLTVVEKPLNSDRPGGASNPRTETTEQRLAREANAYAGVA